MACLNLMSCAVASHNRLLSTAGVNCYRELLLPTAVAHLVMDVAYSPTGTEFVSASYDRTIRIFAVDKGHSR